MGLFGFVGKLLGGAVKVAANIATGNPLGAVKAGLGTVSSLISHKTPMQHTATKINLMGRMPVTLMRGNGTQSTPGFVGPVERRMSPVLPGGAIATRAGPVAASSSTPPATYGGQVKRRKRTTSRKRSTARRSKKRSAGRKLKFGSPAWRKKYMKKRRRR